MKSSGSLPFLAIGTVTLVLFACSQEGNRGATVSAQLTESPVHILPDTPSADMLACADSFAPVVPETGTYSRPVDAKYPLTQTYFDQGLRLTYGYYFPEAVASFDAALCLEPENAMLHWGKALALGPNPNSRYSGRPDDPHGLGERSIALAQAGAGEVSDADSGLIRALSVLYDTTSYSDQTSRTEAFIESAVANYQVHHNDLEAAFLVPHAIMMSTPWAYYTSGSGAPMAGIPRALEVLERGIALHPEHPGLTHLHVHLLEASNTPSRAEASADRLASLTPMAGYMVHMPGHIYMRLGRYEDAISTNERSLDADDYLQLMWGDRALRHQGTDNMSSLSHGAHASNFIHWASILQGNRAAAIEISQYDAAYVKTTELHHGNGSRTLAAHWMTLRAFGLFDDLLATVNPAPDNPYLKGLLHWLHGAAHANKGHLAAAREELAALQSTRTSPGLSAIKASVNTASDLLGIAEAMLAGEIANAELDYDMAIKHFAHGVSLQEQLAYMEPPDWLQSTRLYLGQALINAGRPEDAVAVFERDLQLLQNNGWALRGLADALHAAEDPERAARIEVRFAEAWEDADISLPAAHF
ncbi:tetratricopeptide repeat protein [Pseudohongiella nitratireducens]|uniref:tetratricopeptide repeat protein n=1 Tax=Pseudohongiella nitratireducens TaxID=1768907 RepID=UPI00083ABD22|nr:tetratricopeptide repeat protein [Pseudohongiella nitratireducens]MDF1622115.1 tetratricopeptide repeat protein [Pseudohongiella nitratireducens]